MKKSVLHKLGLFLLVSVLTLSFSSCEEDSYWKAATLDVGTRAISRNDGYFQQTIRVRDIDINDLRPHEDLLDIRLIESEVYLIMSANDIVDDLEIDINDRYISYRHGGIIRPGYVIQNNSYFNFMQEAMEILRRNGYIDITVSGYSDFRNAAIDFEFVNDLDIRVRD